MSTKFSPRRRHNQRQFPNPHSLYTNTDTQVQTESDSYKYTTQPAGNIKIEINNK